MEDCILISLHGYGTWLPDHDMGFIRRNEGWKPADPKLAECYREQMRFAPTVFSGTDQQVLAEEYLVACEKQQYVPHSFASETTHLHLLLTLETSRPVSLIRSRLKESFSRRLNRESDRREWFSKGGHIGAVKDFEHYDYLRDIYLPSHRGWRWDERIGFSEPR